MQTELNFYHARTIEVTLLNLSPLATYLDKGIPDIQALLHTERRGDTFTTSDQGSCGQTHHHILGLHLVNKNKQHQRNGGNKNTKKW